MAAKDLESGLSAELLDAALAEMSIAVALADASGKVLSANAEFKSWLSDDTAGLVALVADLITSDSANRDVELPDGRSFIVQQKALPDGNRLLTLRDTTAENTTARLARERAEQLAAIMEHVPDGVAFLDENCDLVLANDEFYEAFDFPREMGPGTAGVDFTRIILERQQGLSGPELHQAAEERLARIYRECGGGGVSWDTETRADGRIIEIRRRISPQGAMVETYIDVTEREHALSEARDAVSRYRAVVEDQTEMICRFDSDYRLTFANSAYRQAFEQPGDDLIGRSIFDLIPEDEARGAILRGLEGLTPENPLMKDTYQETTADGAPSWQTWINRAIFDDAGKVIEYQAVGRDVTIEREAGAALAQAEKLAAMGSLLASVSHELNNPLSIVLGQAQLLQELASEPATAERAERIRVAAERCAKIVRTFLSMARKKPPDPVQLDLAEIALGGLELMQYSLSTSDVEVTCDLPLGLGPVMGDRDQLIQIVVNLLVNAQQALSAEPGPRNVHMGVSVTGESVLLAISDTGPGIPPALREKVFEPFFTTKPEGIGTGIGLAMCRNIAVAHNGTLDYVDHGKGAEFHLHLPLASEAEISEAEDEAALWSALPPLNILFVDDESDIAATAVEILEAGGHRVVTAGHGQQALDILQRGTPEIDLIVTDLRMPVMDGPALWRAIDESGLHPTSAIGFVTGDTLSPEIQAFLKRTNAPLADKPLAAGDLRRLIIQLVTGEA